MTYLKIVFLIIFLTFSTLVIAQFGTLKGKITEVDSITPISYANVTIESGGMRLWETFSDINGNYKIVSIAAGKYFVKISCIGYGDVYYMDVIIKPDKITFLDFFTERIIGESLKLIEYREPLIEKDASPSGETIIMK